jgi:hypothetical protein
MPHFRLLDADFLVNYIRTLSLVQVYEPTLNTKISHFCNHCPYDLVTTKHVEIEVNNKIGYRNPTNHDEFFKSKKQEAQRIKREIFRNIRIIDIRNNNLMESLQSIWPRNPGEQSLVVLLSSKYADFVNSTTNSVRIISNNSKDIYPPLRIAKQFNNRLSKMDEVEMVVSNHDFYYDLFTQLHYDKPFKNYYYFVSNIDARVFDKNKVNHMINRD